MRFKAEVSNVAALNRLINSIERLSQRGILKLTREKTYIICAGESNTSGGPQVWSQISNSSVFSDFKIESNTDNQIFLEFVPLTFAKVLKLSPGSTSITIKLAKKSTTNHPILSFNFASASRSGHSQTIVHEVLVRVLKLSELEEMAKEPMCPEPDVHIMLPNPPDGMRGVVERMKNLSGVIKISANQQGTMRLRAEGDLANIETTWTNLKHPEIDLQPSQTQDPVDPAEFHTVGIEAKHLLKLLYALANGTHTIACICADHCLIAYLYVGDGRDSQVEGASVLTFYVPGHSEGV